MFIHVNKHFDEKTTKIAKEVYAKSKRVLIKVNQQFKLNYSDQEKICELENNYFIKFKEVSHNGFDIEDKEQKYEQLGDAGVKIFVVMLNYLDKLEKEEQTKGNRINLNNQNIIFFIQPLSLN